MDNKPDVEVNHPPSDIYEINHCEYLNVRARPNSDETTVIDRFDKLLITDDLDEWVKVEVITRDGLTGYVKKEFLTEV